MRRRTKFYILIGWILLDIIIIANIPASLVLSLVKREVQIPDAAAYQASGTLWRGSVALNSTEPPSKFTWRIHFLPLFKGNFGYMTTYATKDSSVKADVYFHLSGLSIEHLSGYLDASIANHLLKLLSIEIERAVFLKDVQMTIGKQGGIEQLSGLLTWPGGNTSVVTGSGNLLLYVPAMEAELSTSEEMVLIKLVDVTQKKEAARAEIRNGRSISIEMRRHLIDLIGVPQGEGNEDDVVFRTSLGITAQ